MSRDPRRVVDPYLSRIARKAWPYAEVTVALSPGVGEQLRSDYRLRKPGEQEETQLATTFNDAKTRLREMVSDALAGESFPPDSALVTRRFHSLKEFDAAYPENEDGVLSVARRFERGEIDVEVATLLIQEAIDKGPAPPHPLAAYLKAVAARFRGDVVA